MPFSFGAGVRDSLSNLAASLGAGKDKAAHDAFTVFDLGRAQVEAMYRGDWLARKVVDIVPYDSVRSWRSWSGHSADVARFEAAERRLGLRKTVQRAMVLGRLYGGGAILIGDGEEDPAALARPLDERLPCGGLSFLHAVSRWQLGVSETELNPLSPWCGEPKMYTLSAPGLPPLELHPSRVVRFLGNPLPDPSLAGALWSDSVLQALYDAVHAAALSLAGAMSLLHEAKVDIVTVPNLSEHLSSAETTAQLSARFAYAAAMKSMNNLLLLGDGESWSRQSVDFAGLPEMARTFLQVAAGAADIPVTRLLGQSPAGLSATGESDVRNYYDMIAARQELDLRPQLERLDRLICRSEGIDPGALTFAFRPLWQLDEPAKAALALAKAQATQVYAGLKLWPDAVMARLAEAKLAADGTYPNTAAVFVETHALDPDSTSPVLDYDPTEPRDLRGRWARAGGEAGTAAGGARAPGQVQAEPFLPPLSLSELLGLLNPVGTAQAAGEPPEEMSRRSDEPAEAAELQPDEVIRNQRFTAAWEALKQIDPDNNAFRILRAPGASTTEAEVESLEGAARKARIAAWRTAESRSENSSPLAPQPQPPQSALNRYYGSPQLPGPFEAALYPEIEAGPEGVTLEPEGRNATNRGSSYEKILVEHLDLDKPDETWEVRGLKPDAAASDMAIEVKYTDDFSRSIYNPERGLPFADREVNDTIEQAMKYAGGSPPKEMLYYTNDWSLAEYYTRAFRGVGLSKFRFIIVPATRRSK